MAAASPVSAQPNWRATFGLQIGLIALLLACWTALSASGLLFRDVVPPLDQIVRALAAEMLSPVFWSSAAVTLAEIAAAMVVSTGAGVMVGLLLGGSRFFGQSFEPYLYYLGPTPKIILFPVLLMGFGVGPNSKVAMGALSGFFPIALNTLAAVRGVNPALIRVGQSLGVNKLQMATKILLPAIRLPVANGVRLGFGLAVVGVLLAETKLSNKGVGFLVMQAYTRFDMPQTYALLILVFAFAVGANAAFTALLRRSGRHA